MILLQKTSPCDQSDCQNGAQCLEGVEGEPMCRCLPGFFGSKCEKMITVHFLGKDTYVELPAAKIRPPMHISLQVHLEILPVTLNNGSQISYFRLIDMDLAYHYICQTHILCSHEKQSTPSNIYSRGFSSAVLL